MVICISNRIAMGRDFNGRGSKPVECVSEGCPLTHGLLAMQKGSTVKISQNRRKTGEMLEKESGRRNGQKQGVSFPKQEGWQVCPAAFVVLSE